MLKAFFYGIMIEIIIFGVVYAALIGMSREAKINDDTRKERCARMGENIPPALESYCANIGV